MLPIFCSLDSIFDNKQDVPEPSVFCHNFQKYTCGSGVPSKHNMKSKIIERPGPDTLYIKSPVIVQVHTHHVDKIKDIILLSPRVLFENRYRLKAELSVKWPRSMIPQLPPPLSPTNGVLGCFKLSIIVTKHIFVSFLVSTNLMITYLLQIPLQ